MTVVIVNKEKDFLMQTVMSKSQFKPKALEYLRIVERLNQPLTITHEGKPVIQVVPYTQKKKNPLQELAGTVIEYQNPTEPIGEGEWEALR